MMKDEIGSAEPPQWQRSTGWSENEQVPLASREHRCYKASICATRQARHSEEPKGDEESASAFVEE